MLMKTLKKKSENHKGKKENLHDLLIKSSHISAAICPRLMNRVPNLSLDSGLSPGVSHMQIIEFAYS